MHGVKSGLYEEEIAEERHSERSEIFLDGLQNMIAFRIDVDRRSLPPGNGAGSVVLRLKRQSGCWCAIGVYGDPALQRYLKYGPP